MRNNIIPYIICIILIIFICFLYKEKIVVPAPYVPVTISEGEEFRILPTDSYPTKLETSEKNGKTTSLSFDKDVTGLKFFVYDDMSYDEKNQIVTYSEDGKSITIECIKDCEKNNEILLYNDYYDIPYIKIK